MTRSFLEINDISVVGLANNHSRNFGEKGLRETTEFLRSFGVDYFGDSLEEEKYLSVEKNGQKFSFVAFDQFGGAGEEEALRDIRQAKEDGNFVILFAHWGIEYTSVQNEKQTVLARKFIDAGADLIVGAHPHVVQPMEIYKGKVIFYSLGNFIFDQSFSEEVKTRLAVGMIVENSGLSFYLAPLYLEKNGQLEIMTGKKRENCF